MADEPLALTVQVSPPTEADYDAILNAVMETERGRWFLLQYARRNRNADTRLLLSALDRIEAMLRGKAGGDGALRAELDRLNRAVAEAKAKFAEISASVASVAGINAVNDYEGAAAAVTSAAAAIGDGIEHLQEIAWFMHENKLDASLCANLESTTREIAAACALLEQADRGMRTATTLMMDIEARLAALIGRPGGAGRQAGAGAGGDATPAGASAHRPHDSAPPPRERTATAANTPVGDVPPHASPPPVTSAAAKPATLPPPPPATTRRPQPGRGWLSQLLARDAQARVAGPAAAPRPAPATDPAAGGVPSSSVGPSAANPGTPMPRGPLAQVAAMSDEEKIALFT